jgi:hypothetical protein
MRAYVWNKVFSLAIPISAIGFAAFFLPEPQSWTILLVLVSFVGYTHYVLGSYYQLKAWRRRSTYPRFLLSFLVFTGLSVIAMVGAVYLEVVWLVALLTIPYFIWHGYENEQTLFTRATGKVLSTALVCGLSLLAVGATMDAFRHTSASFNHGLMYDLHIVPKFTGDLAIINTGLLVIGVFCLGMGAFFVWYHWWQRRSYVAAWWSSVTLFILTWFYFANPLPYVWLFVLLLSYHFITWGLHFAVVFWPQQKRFFAYLFGHGVVIVGVIVLSLLLDQYTEQFPLGLLNTEFFLTATLIHISTSSLNDVWLQKLLRLT